MANVSLGKGIFSPHKNRIIWFSLSMVLNSLAQDCNKCELVWTDCLGHVNKGHRSSTEAI